MLAQQIPTTTTTATITSTVPSTSPNNNWLYAGTDEAWLYTDYSQPPYNICTCTEAETTAYKLPL